MNVMPFLFHIILMVNTNFKYDYTVKLYHRLCGFVEVVSLNKNRTSIDELSYIKLKPKFFVETESNPSTSLEEVLKKDVDSQGIISNILGGLALFYNALTRIMLYPIFSFLLLMLSVGGMVLLAVLVKKIKDDQPISNFLTIFCSLYVLVYLDLFLVVYQKSKILFLFLELEKDLLLITIASIIGYIVGKFSSSQVFEEKKLP